MAQEGFIGGPFASKEMLRALNTHPSHPTVLSPHLAQCQPPTAPPIPVPLHSVSLIAAVSVSDSCLQEVGESAKAKFLFGWLQRLA
jgi:hypothetical protein